MKEYKLETNNGFLAGSVQVKQVEFKAHTDSYETESFDWDNICFE